MDSPDRILVFIPMYNCAQQIPRVLAQITPEVQDLIEEVLVVDNRSMDQSCQRVQEAMGDLSNCRVTLWKNDSNYSLGGSHKVAFLYALQHDMDYLIVLHGDDQGSIKDLLPILKKGVHRSHHAMLGSRFTQGSKRFDYSAFRTCGNVALNAVCSLAAGRRISDMGAGLNLYSRSFLVDRSYLRFPNDLTFNVFLLFHGISRRDDFVFFPLTWRETDQASNARVFRQGWRILKLIFNYRFRRHRFSSQEENNYSRMTYSGKIIAQTST